MARVDIGDGTYDAFASVDFADEFLGGDIMRAVPWATKNDDAKGRGLVSATRAMMQLPWKGEAPTVEAPPVVVMEVSAMLAADMVSKPKLFADASGNSNVKIAKAGPAQVEFFQPVGDAPPIPLALWTMLLNAGLVRGPVVTSENDGPLVSGISDGCRPLGGRPLWDYPVAACDHD